MCIEETKKVSHGCFEELWELGVFELDISFTGFSEILGFRRVIGG